MVVLREPDVTVTVACRDPELSAAALTVNRRPAPELGDTVSQLADDVAVQFCPPASTKTRREPPERVTSHATWETFSPR
jgi:hypothetical protein